MAKKGSHIYCAKDQVESRLDFGCQIHTSGTVNLFIRVPSLTTGKIPNVTTLVAVGLILPLAMYTTNVTYVLLMCSFISVLNLLCT